MSDRLSWAAMNAVWHTVVGRSGPDQGAAARPAPHRAAAGTALVAGSGGTALFGALGLLASVPMLVRLYRRFCSWIAPALGLLVFTAMFSCPQECGTSKIRSSRRLWAVGEATWHRPCPGHSQRTPQFITVLLFLSFVGTHGVAGMV